MTEAVNNRELYEQYRQQQLGYLSLALEASDQMEKYRVLMIQEEQEPVETPGQPSATSEATLPL